MAGLDKALASAKELAAGKDLPGAIAQLRDILLGNELTDVETIKVKEQAVQALTDAYVAARDAQALAGLLSELRQFFAAIPKAKTAKLVRSIIDQIAKVPNSTDLQVRVCKEQVEWAKAEKRTFLRQRIELRLASLYLELKDYKPALALIGTWVAPPPNRGQRAGGGCACCARCAAAARRGVRCAVPHCTERRWLGRRS
jgi:26S proteasome regulatory subunit N6